MSYSPQEVRNGLFAFGFSLIYTLALIPNDFLLIADGNLLAVVLSLRVVTVLLVALAIGRILRKGRGWSYELWVALASWSLTLLDCAVSLTRGSGQWFSFLPSILIVAFLYFAIPARLGTKVSVGVFLSLWELGYAALFKEFPEGALTVMALTYSGLNIIGVINNVILQRYRRVETAYRERIGDELRFQKALSNTNYEAVMLCEDNLVADLNQSLAELLGWKSEEIRGKPVRQFISVAPQSEPAFLSGGEVSASLLAKEGEIPVKAVLKEVEVDGLRLTAIVLCTSQVAQPFAQRLASLPLSLREIQVATGILSGHSRYQIGAELYISDETVKKHTSNIYRKLGIRSKVGLARLVLENP